ncbi:hypothetical protein [Fusibacter ferrireducens]|uniref:Uncharacterized protein n=1 Tax=Fusibacter ferrireducens TaxID=2785058 RepID=A0ABR9ZYL9_9FIRM|nr:hypothetical protein [Fusibacter ferrireducens]MBF4695562.1 hypothetical protein [Fusibacter ferrireducens]
MKKNLIKFQKVFQINLLICLILITSTTSYANSGPIVIEGYPGSEMIVDESNEIIVNHETLTFELTDDLYTQGARVQATYEMENTSDTNQTIHMVFPLVSTLKMLQGHVSILNDTTPIPLEKIYLDRINTPNNLPDFKTLLKLSPVKAPFLTSDLTCYEFIPQTSLSEMHVEISFNLTDSDAFILIQNSSGYGYDNGKFSVSSWLGKTSNFSENLRIYLTKGALQNLEYTITDRSSDKVIEQGNALKEQGNTPKSLSVNESVLSKTDMNGILEKILFMEEPDIYTQSEREQILNNALHELYEMYDFSMIVLDDLKQYLNQNRIVLLTYDIPFEPKQTHEITVSYPLKGTFDRRNSDEPTYTFEYFLNPASYWKDFKQLALAIHLKAPYDYIISSSLPLERRTQADQVSYQALFDQVPETDLTFTVYTAEKVTALDKLKGKWSRSYSYIFFLIVLPILVIVSIVGALMWIIHKIRKR